MNTDVVKSAKVEEKVCGRCAGKGVLNCYSHVLRGICFRCWGLGTDPKTVQELEAWLVRARREYAVRRDMVRAGKGSPVVEKEMALIAKLGKQNRRRADNLRAAFTALAQDAKSKG